MLSENPWNIYIYIYIYIYVLVFMRAPDFHVPRYRRSRSRSICRLSVIRSSKGNILIVFRTNFLTAVKILG